MKYTILRRHYETEKPKFIIIHDSVEIKVPGIKTDSNNIEYNKIKKFSIMNKSQFDVNYHYFVENIINDYEIIVGRPIGIKCDFPDIDDNFNRKAIHICIIGDYSITVPEPRLYEILSYRLIAPIMKNYNIMIGNVLLHKDFNLKSYCPGDFFNIAMLKSYIRRFL